jgi:hypothetical protein
MYVPRIGVAESEKVSDMSDFYPVGRGIDKDQEIEMLSGYEG